MSQQQLNHLRVPAALRDVEWRPSLRGGGADVGAPVEQECGHLLTAPTRGHVQGRAPPTVVHLKVGAGVEEQSDHVRPVVVARPVQRRAAVTADGVHRRVGLHELCEDAPMAADPGPVQGGVAGVVGGRDGVRVLLEQLVDRVAVTAPGRVDNVGDGVVRPGGEGNQE